MLGQFGQRLFRRMCSSHNAIASARDVGRQVLPKDLVPRHYRLLLEPDLAAFTYEGQVEIDLDVAKPTRTVSLNILDLTIKSVQLGDKAPVDTKYDEDAQTVSWTFSDEIHKTSTLKVDFDGVLNDKLAGFYRSVHKDEHGNKQVVATTQMEATDCRRAFPCFDEPNLKATFDISIVAEEKYTVLSNSDVKATSKVGDKVRTDFNTTPKMSTYLVAFVVGELAYVESNAFRVPVRAYATPGLEKRCQFSVDLAAKTLEFFEKTFGIEYPLPKCDMVGIHDFSSGAMENWGLITYRVVDIYFTEGEDSAATKMRVAEVVQHELAHQWFGNLVTMDWWDGLWLNEGFATWMSWYSANHFFPNWKVWESYVSGAYQGCLDLDGLRSSHPIEVPVQRADEISQIFDAISYLKGSCVIKMISQYLGEDVFIKGIAYYLKKHQYGNTETHDLWDALSHVSGKDISAQMDVWTKKIGYPLITVEEDNKVKVTQNRYLQTADVSAEDDETIYPVWLGVRGPSGEVDHSKVLTSRTETLDIDVSAFYKLNADQNGIFRVKYPESRLQQLAAEGNKGRASLLTSEDRIGLISDLSALSGGYSKTSSLLSVIDAWKTSETESTVWTAITSFLGKLSHTWAFEDQKTRDAVKRFIADVCVPKSKELGWTFSEQDTFQSETLKASLFSTGVKVDDPELTEAALALYANGWEKINPNLRGAVFQAVAKHGTREQWESVFDIYKAGTNGVTGNSALTACGFSRDPERKAVILDAILDGTTRAQDAYISLVGVTATGTGHEQAWEWTKREWPRIRERFPASLGLLSKFVLAVGGFTKQEQLEAFDAFFSQQDVRGIDKQVEIAKDRMRHSIGWLAADGEDVSKWLEAKGFVE